MSRTSTLSPDVGEQPAPAARGWTKSWNRAGRAHNTVERARANTVASTVFNHPRPTPRRSGAAPQHGSGVTHAGFDSAGQPGAMPSAGAADEQTSQSTTVAAWAALAAAVGLVGFVVLSVVASNIRALSRRARGSASRRRLNW